MSAWPRYPATGGSQRQFTCELTPNSINLTDALESAAPAADGRLAFFAATSNIGATRPNVQGIALGSVLEPATDHMLQSVPYTLPRRQAAYGSVPDPLARRQPDRVPGRGGHRLQTLPVLFARHVAHRT